MKLTLKKILLIMFLLGMVFLIFGHINIYNESVLAEIDDEYLGLAKVEADKDYLTFTLENTDNIAEPISLTVAVADLTNGEQIAEGNLGETVHLYADLALINAHEEKRTIVSGRLKEESDEEFYRIIRLKAVSLLESNLEFKQSVEQTMIRWQEEGM